MSLSPSPLQPNADFRIGTILAESWRLYCAHPSRYLVTVGAPVAVMAFLLHAVVPPFGSFLADFFDVFILAAFLPGPIAAISIGVAGAAGEKPYLLVVLFRAFWVRGRLWLVGGTVFLPFALLIVVNASPGVELGLMALAFSLAITTFFWPIIPVVAVERPAPWHAVRRALRLSRGYRIQILMLEIVLLVPGLALATAARYLIEQGVDSHVVFAAGWALFIPWFLLVAFAMIVTFFILRDETGPPEAGPWRKYFDRDAS